MNKVDLVGNVGQVISNNEGDEKSAVLVFSLATQRKYYDKSEQEVTKTEWHKIVCFGVLACRVRKVIKVGQRLFVSGRLNYSNYIDKDGTKRKDMSIITNDLVIGMKF